MPNEQLAPPSAAAMRAAIDAYVSRINDGDLPGILALFEPLAIIEDPVGSPPKTGDAIRSWFIDTIAYGTYITPVAPIRGSHANAAALVFDVTFTPPGGTPMLIRSLDVCTFSPRGLILTLKAYWGPEDMQTLSG
jgi:steroid delta-isomerase